MNAQFDDPKLTAYALGDSLPDEERQAVERLLAESPEACAMVDEMRALRAGLRAEYDAQRTNTPSRELANIIELSEARRETPMARSTTHLPRVAALVVASLAIASIAWFTIRPGERDRIVTAKSKASAPGASGETDPNASLEMEMEGPAGSAAAPRDNPSYETVRRSLRANQLPPKNAVRIEEMVNHFSYRYAASTANAGDPFAVHLEVASAPWKSAHRLVRIGVKGREVTPGQRPTGTVATTAKDVNLEVEFNPARVAAYRLIGYENQPSKKENSAFDRIDVGEIDAGRTVTALYEIVPAGRSVPPAGFVDALPYQTPTPTSAAAASAEMLTVKMRYKLPGGKISELVDFPLVDDGRPFEAATADFKFVSAVAGFAMLLRDSPERGDATPDSIAKWADAGLSDDTAGHRAEFIELVRKAESLLAVGRPGPS